VVYGSDTRIPIEAENFSWSAIVLVVLITLVVASLPEILARAIFINRYSAPKMLLVPYLGRFDRNMAVMVTHAVGPSGAERHRGIQTGSVRYRPYVGFTPVPDFRPTPTAEKKRFRVFFVGGSAMEISARRAVRDLQETLNRKGCRVEVITLEGVHTSAAKRW